MENEPHIYCAGNHVTLPLSLQLQALCKETIKSDPEYPLLKGLCYINFIDYFAERITLYKGITPQGHSICSLFWVTTLCNNLSF